MRTQLNICCVRGQVTAHEADTHHENPPTVYLIYRLLVLSLRELDLGASTRLVTAFRGLIDALMVTQKTMTSLFTGHAPTFETTSVFLEPVRSCYSIELQFFFFLNQVGHFPFCIYYSDSSINR